VSQITTTPAEGRALARAARAAQAARAIQQLHTADRQAAAAAAIADRARADVVEAIIDVAPLLTPQDREQLRGALA
jgi:hypothetical protein